MSMLVTVKQAADHLKIDDYADEISDLTIKIIAASEVVLNYIERELTDYEDDSDGNSTVPKTLQAATLLLVGDMHRHRDSEMPTYSEAYLPPAVRALLYPLKTWGNDE